MNCPSNLFSFFFLTESSSRDFSWLQGNVCRFLYWAHRYTEHTVLLVSTHGELWNVHVSIRGPLIYIESRTLLLCCRHIQLCTCVVSQCPFYPSECLLTIFFSPVFLSCLSDDSGAKRTKPIYFCLWYLNWFSSIFSLVDEDKDLLFAWGRLKLTGVSAGRVGRPLRSLVQIPAPGWAELHVEVSLSKILNPKLLLMCSWHLAWWPLPSVRTAGIGSSTNPATPWSGYRMDGSCLPKKLNIKGQSPDQCTFCIAILYVI